MSDPTVSAYLTKLLCSRGGRLPRSLLPTFLNLSTEQIEQILQDEPQKFPLAEELVLARSPIRTCTNYVENIPEEECDKLHLCRHYLQGKCWADRRQRCTFSHDVFSDHNWTVLEANEISGLNEDEIKVLLLQNDNQLLPEVGSPRMNKRGREYPFCAAFCLEESKITVCENYLGDYCDLAEDCSRLHICGSFLRGECAGGDCGRSHHLLEFGSDLLLSRCHVPELSIKNFQTLCTVRYNERLQEKQQYKEGTPTAVSGPRKRKNSADASQNGSHGRQQETAESNSQRASDSRPMPGNGVICLPSTEDDDDDDYEKAVKMFIVQDLKSSDTPHPLPVPSPLVTDFHRSSIQSTLPVTSPKVSSALRNDWVIIPHMVPDNKSRISPTGFPAGLSSASQGPSAPQPKPTTTSVTTDRPANASPVHMDAPSVSKQKTVAPFDEPVAPFLVVNSSTVPPTLVTSPVTLVDSLTKDPSAAQPKPTIIPVTTDGPANASPVHMDAPSVSKQKTVAPFDEPVAPFLVVNSSTVPPTLVTSPVTLVDSLTKNPSAAQPKPTIIPVTTDGPANASPVHMDAPSVSKQKTVAPFDEPVAPFLVVNSSTVPPTLVTSPVTLVDSLTKDPSAAQPKPTIIPVTTNGPANASPVNVPMDAPSVSKAKPIVPFDPAAPFLVVDSSTVPPTLFIGSVGLTDSPTKGPSASQENPVNTPFSSPYSAQPVVTPITLVTSPIANSASAPSTSDPRLVNSFICSWGPSVPPENPVTTHIASPNVSTIKLVSFPAASPSSATPTPDPSLVNSPTKSHFFFQDKPVTTTIFSPYNVVTTIKPVTSTVASPSTAPSTLHQLTTLDNFPTKDPFVPLENPIQSSVQSQPPGLPVVTNPDPEKVPEICLSNLWKHCKLEGRCLDMHYYLPYRWQIYTGTDWEDISSMEEIEICYSVPAVDRVHSIDFVTMRCGEHRIRRLSTVSSVTKPPEYVLTTEWLWYWKDEYGNWRQYGHSNVQQVSAVASSSDLENVYLADPTSVLPFTTGIHRYEINFQEMKQKNVLYRTEKDVRRRPKYLSFEDVKLLKGRTKSSALSPLKTVIYPRTWNTSALPEIGCTKVPVSDTSSEFSEIVGSFTKTVSGHVVRNIWRLQNPFLWQLFQWQKEHMRQVNQGRDVKELKLFHGTELTHVDAICNQNFDWRICGTHGTVFGQGSYFARDASYSLNYSKPMVGGIQMMFVARVLVGDYVLGSPQMKRPPLRPGSTMRYYDSCVDKMLNPSIFVVFEKHQIYPEYLLGYEQQKKS